MLLVRRYGILPEDPATTGWLCKAKKVDEIFPFIAHRLPKAGIGIRWSPARRILAAILKST